MGFEFRSSDCKAKAPSTLFHRVKFEPKSSDSKDKAPFTLSHRGEGIRDESLAPPQISLAPLLLGVLSLWVQHNPSGSQVLAQKSRLLPCRAVGTLCHEATSWSPPPPWPLGVSERCWAPRSRVGKDLRSHQVTSTLIPEETSLVRVSLDGEPWRDGLSVNPGLSAGPGIQ